MKKKLAAISACVILILVSIAFPVSRAPPYQPSTPNPASAQIDDHFIINFNIIG